MQKIKSIEEELLEAKQHLRDKEIVLGNILESALTGYWDWQIQEDYEYMSPSFKKMLGYEDHEMENRPEAWQTIIHPEDLTMLLESFERHVSSKGKMPYDNEVRYFHKDGSIVHIYCRGKVIEWDENGQPLRMVGCHMDISQIKHAEETRKRSEQLEIKNKELEQFAYIASHDLQEPLHTLNSFVKLFKTEYTDHLDDTADIYMNFILDATHRMSGLINGLLDYSRIGRNRATELVDCNMLVADIQKELAGLIEAERVSMNVGKLPEIKAYKKELYQHFKNLITNAIKFRKEGIDPLITIKAVQENGHWRFSVTDNGIGIKQEHLDRIFMIYQRLHLQNEFEGSGIGLAHAKKIVELHHGKIWVISHPGIGSTFYFTIEL